MRSRALNAVAIAAGIAVALVVLGVGTNFLPPGPAVTILAAGSSETIPAFHNETVGANYSCGQIPCGTPGELWFRFSVSPHARLSGSLQAAAPIAVWVGNGLGMEAACTLSNPPPSCAPSAETGPAYLYQTSSDVLSIDFSQLVFDFGGGGTELPAGGWTLLLINWSDTPVLLTAPSGVQEVPTW